MIISFSTVTLVISVLALIIGLYSLVQVMSLNKLRKNFFAGTKALDLESVIESLQTELKSTAEYQTVLEQALKQLEYNTSFSVQKVGLVRFNPFDDGGGNFSFSLALLDSHNTGVVITSMHGRQQNRIYTKNIENGSSEHKLTDEEVLAVQTANSNNQEAKPKKISRAA